MKVCHIVDHLPHYHQNCGGAEQAAFKVIVGLKNKGIETSVICVKPDSEFKEDGLQIYPVIPLARKFNHLLNKAIHNFQNLFLPCDPVSFRLVYRYIKIIRPDIIHVHKSDLLGLAVVKCGSLLRIPVVMSVYDYLPFCPKQILLNEKEAICFDFHGARCIKCFKLGFLGCGSLFFLFRRRIFDSFLNKVSKFIVLSRHSRNLLVSYGIEENRLEIVHQIMKLQQSDGCFPMEKDLIFFAGWLKAHKGLHVIIKAMPLIMKAIPGAHLKVSGLKSDEKYFREIISLIERLNIDNNIEFTGRLSRSEFLNEIDKANVIVVPEQWPNMSPVIVAEAMLLNKVVVAADIGGIPEFIRDGKTGYLAIPDNPNSWAEKITRVLGDNNLVAELGGTAGTVAADLFNEKIILSKIEAIYMDLASEEV